MKSEVMMITPAIAKELLVGNTKNRRISRETVARYAHMMRNNQWHSNGESISIAEDGTLINGQHRLLACIEANTPFCCVVVTGVRKQDAAVFDMGKARNRVGTLEIAQKHGEIKDDPMLRSNTIIATAAFILGVMQTREQTGNKDAIDADRYGKWITAEDCVAYIMRHENAFRFVYEKLACRVFRRAPVAAAIIHAYESGYNMAKLERLCEVLVDGMTADPKERCIIRLRDFAMTLKGGSSTTRKSLYMRTQNMLHLYDIGSASARSMESKKEHYTGGYE